MDLHLEQVAHQYNSYGARTSPPGRSLGSKSAQKTNTTEKQDHHVLQSKASDEYGELVVERGVCCEVCRADHNQGR